MITAPQYQTEFLRELSFHFEGMSYRRQNPRMAFHSWLEQHGRAADVYLGQQHLGTVVAAGQSWYLWQLPDRTDSGGTKSAIEALLILWYGTRQTGAWLYK